MKTPEEMKELAERSVPGMLIDEASGHLLLKISGTKDGYDLTPLDQPYKSFIIESREWVPWAAQRIIRAEYLFKEFMRRRAEGRSNGEGHYSIKEWINEVDEFLEDSPCEP